MNPRNIFGLVLCAYFSVVQAADWSVEPDLDKYFSGQVERISERGLATINGLEDWEKEKGKYREELFEMLGLSPLPEKTDLKPVVTGKLEEADFLVEKLHFQSSPGLYVTANLYLPKKVEKPLPAILYVCGHAQVKSNGISYGNKTAYQHHGAWFARNGYICLVIDTLQLGEIEGLHHGTYREGMWWWNSRGYTPAGVEAWNCIRALDYLETRPEVDKSRFGVTGRSGGGAYSWWVTALDERIKASAPVAGITDLEDHVIDGVVEGHCDCMYMVNSHRWDYPIVAALAAPRPLLIANTDKDSIFPLDGVVRLHSAVAKIYGYYQAKDKLGLLITEGPHEDTQDLQLPVFRWFNRHLKGQDPVIETAARKFFAPEDLRVFQELPADQINTRIHEEFVPKFNRSEAQPERSVEELREVLRSKVFAGWPESSDLNLNRQGDKISFDSQEDVHLEMEMILGADPQRCVLHVLGDDEPAPASEPGSLTIAFRPRGNWDGDEKKKIQIRRRFMMVGQTADSMRVWDILQAFEVMRSIPETKSLPLEVKANGPMAVNVLYATLFASEAPKSLSLAEVPESHEEGPDYLNVMRVTELPEVVRAVSRLRQPSPEVTPASK